MLLISGRYVMFIMESIWKKTQIKKQKFMSIIMLRCNKSTSVALTQVSRWIIQNFMRAKAFERRSASCINNHLSLFFSPSSNVLQESDGDIQSSWGSWQRHLGITCTSWVSGRETERRERDNILNSKTSPHRWCVHYNEISLFKRRSYVVNERLYICIGHWYPLRTHKKKAVKSWVQCVFPSFRSWQTRMKKSRKKRERKLQHSWQLWYTHTILDKVKVVSKERNPDIKKSHRVSIKRWRQEWI